MKKTKSHTTILWIVGTIIVAGSLIGFLVYEGKKPGQYDQVAQCINDSGAKFYGAWWCPHCQRQKAMFGKSGKKLPYVECQTQDQKQMQVCIDAKIEGYPTWVFPDGSRLSGEIPMSTLIEKTSCSAAAAPLPSTTTSGASTVAPVMEPKQ